MERDELGQCQALYDAHEAQQALARLEAVAWSPDAGAPSTDLVDALLLKLRCQMRLERFRDAFRQADLLATPVPPEARASEVLRLRGMAWRLAHGMVDRAILDLVRALELEAEPARRALVGAELAFSWGLKGCFESAFAAVDRAREADAASEPMLAYRHGQLLLMVRDLPGARACFDELAEHPDGERLARDGLAYLELADGRIGQAAAHLDALGPAHADELWLHRRKLEVLVGIDPDSERPLLEEIRRASPRSDRAGQDTLRIAELWYLEGERDRALALCEPLGADPDPVTARRARELASHLRTLRAPSRPHVDRLAGLPFLSRSGDNGPAALELVLGALGRTVESDWMPEVETLGQAAEFFSVAGLRTVRCLGELTELSRLLEVGAPVLVEREGLLYLVVAVDRTRGAVELRAPTESSGRTASAAELAPYVETGCLAVLPPDLESPPVSSHPALAELDKALRFMDEGRDEDAVRLLERLCETMPGHSLPHELLLDLELDQLDWDGADPIEGEPDQELLSAIEQRLEEAERACGLTTGLAICRGEVCEVQGDFKAACAAYERALEDRPDDLALLVRAGEAYRQLGHHEAAERLFWRALEQAGDYPAANASIAGLYCDEQDKRLAKHFLRVALELAPGEPYNQLNAGRLHEMEGAFELAREAYEKALDQRPDDPFVLERISLVLSHLGRYDLALERLAEALGEGLDPETARHLRSQQADILLRAGDAARSLEVATAILEEDPEEPSALAIGGAALVALGQRESGIARLREALARDPDYGWARQQLVTVYREGGRIHDARRELARAIERDPEDEWSQLELAQMLRAMGRHEEAADVLLRASRIVGFGSEQLLAPLIEVLQDLDRGEQAIEQAKLGLARHGDRPAVSRLAVRALADGERWDDLRPHVESLLARTPDDPEMLLFAARLAQRAGDTAQVEALVARAMAKRPDDDEAIFHMVRLLADLERWDEAHKAFGWARAPEEPALCHQGLRILSREPRFAPRCLELARAGNAASAGTNYYYLTQVAFHASALGRREEAREHLSKAIALSPEDPWAYVLLGQLLYPQGEFEAALAAIDRASALGEAKAFCDWCRLDILLEAERWEECERVALALAAVEDGELALAARIQHAGAALRGRGAAAFAEAVTALERDHPLAAAEYAQLAGHAYGAMDWSASRRYVERALAMDPTDELALYHLGLLRERGGDDEGALGAYEDLAVAHPGSHVGHENRGRLLARSGRISEAKPHVARGVELEPRCPAAWSALAHWHLRGGETARALPALLEAWRLEPRRRHAQIDQALMSWLEGDRARAARLLDLAEASAGALGAGWAADLAWARELTGIGRGG